MGKRTLTKSNLFLVTVLCFILAILFSIPSIVEFIQIQRYQTGQCTIRDKHLLRQTGYSSPNAGTYYEIPIFVPNFEFLVSTSGGSHYRAHGYDFDPLGDVSNGRWDDLRNGQAIVDAYQVGRTYPCWYDPTNPTQAVLTRQLDPPLFLQAVVQFLLSGMCVLFATLQLGWRRMRMKMTGGSR